MLHRIYSFSGTRSACYRGGVAPNLYVTTISTVRATSCFCVCETESSEVRSLLHVIRYRERRHIQGVPMMRTCAYGERTFFFAMKIENPRRINPPRWYCVRRDRSGAARVLCMYIAVAPEVLSDNCCNARCKMWQRWQTSIATGEVNRPTISSSHIQYPVSGVTPCMEPSCRTAISSTVR